MKHPFQSPPQHTVDQKTADLTKHVGNFIKVLLDGDEVH